METISTAASNVATAATKMIWGDNNTAPQSGTEPISGVKGSGTATDPYDAGNKEENTPSGLIAEDKESIEAHSGGHNRSDSGAQGVKPAEIHPHHETEKTGVTSMHPAETAPHGQDVRPSEAIHDKLGDPSSAQKPTPKQQGGDRPSEAPKEESTDVIKDQKEQIEDFMKRRSPDDHSGEPMRLHDGSDKEENSPAPGELPEDKSKDESEKENGTGEKWIKTSGVAAEGGDFDAAQAGAGREADRLLESKGVRRSSPDSSSPSQSSGKVPDSPPTKTSLGHKLKEKLHLRKH